jgi:hypothetical protein
MTTKKRMELMSELIGMIAHRSHRESGRLTNDLDLLMVEFADDAGHPCARVRMPTALECLHYDVYQQAPGIERAIGPKVTLVEEGRSESPDMK